MLKINRVRIEIQTENGLYGVDETFNGGLNFLASEDNTCGKSSILAAIYYGLGFEEIIGGRGEKVLTSVYKTSIEAENVIWPVLESGVYLEISNGEEVVTIYRSAKHVNRDSKLMTIYYSNFECIYNSETVVGNMYVHMPNAAVNEKGFHSFLEKFLHLELPLVPTSDGVQRKLYLQLVFSCMFIEQKHGWGDIFSGMPIFGIRESKKRVLEFVMRLDTLNNEKMKEQLRFDEGRIKSEWVALVQELFNCVNKETCTIVGVPLNPCILSGIDLSGIHVFKNKVDVDEYVNELQIEYEKLKTVKTKIVDNFDDLQIELEATEDDIISMDDNIIALREKNAKENVLIKVLENNLETIQNDLQNNKDAARLRDLGAELECLTSKNICPVCNQSIQDSLLPTINTASIMSIDENIRHLDAQKIMFSYALKSHKENKKEIENNIQNLQSKIFTLRRLAKSLRSDIYSTDEDISETLVYKRIKIESQIDDLKKMEEVISNKKKELLELSQKWAGYLKGKEKLPKKKFSKLDEEKLKLLRTGFVDNLKSYGYKSVSNMQDIDISEETYLPIIEGFDMKFDSSASDNIRAIWAFTMSLLQTSIAKGGNHPTVLIFDEPDQHSIVVNDMEQFFDSIISMGNVCQTIIGITIKDSDTKHAIEKLPENSYRIIQVQNKAFRKMEK